METRRYEIKAIAKLPAVHAMIPYHWPNELHKGHLYKLLPSIVHMRKTPIIYWSEIGNMKKTWVFRCAL